MKFKRPNRGASIESQVRADKDRHLRQRDRDELKGKRQALKGLRSQLRDTEQTAGRQCRNRKRAARAGATRRKSELRAQIHDVPAALKAELERIDVECGAHVREITEPIQRRVEELATEIGVKITDRRHSRERAARTPKKSAAERKAQTIGEARRDVELYDPRLLPAFDRLAPTLRPTERQTLSEAFLELAAETPELLDEHTQRHEIGDLDMACAEAIYAGGMGNPQAQLWAAEHCTEAGTAKKRRGKKSSAASRTLGMYGADLVPQEAPPAPKPRAPKRAKKAPRGQQGLSVGAFGAEFLDADPDQLPL